MTIYISPNPGKTSASEIALRAAQILLTHGAAVLMSDALRESCSTAGVVYLPLEQCLEYPYQQGRLHQDALYPDG